MTSGQVVKRPSPDPPPEAASPHTTGGDAPSAQPPEPAPPPVPTGRPHRALVGGEHASRRAPGATAKWRAGKKDTPRDKEKEMDGRDEEEELQIRDAPSSHHKNTGDMLALAELQAIHTHGNGNCGLYAVLKSRNDGCIKHGSPGQPRNSTRSCYEAQAELRLKGVHWWKHTTQRPLLIEEGTFLPGGHPSPEAMEAANKAIDAFYPGAMAPGEFSHAYVSRPMLRAMAAVEGVAIVVINARTNTDLVSLYPPGSSEVIGLLQSWSKDIVPRLTRQRHNARRTSTDGTKECLIRVITWNGRNDGGGHFEATLPSETSTGEWTKQPLVEGNNHNPSNPQEYMRWHHVHHGIPTRRPHTREPTHPDAP